MNHLSLLDKIAIGMAIVVTVVVVALVSCGKPTPPPGPGPNPLTDFSVSSQGVMIQGKLKANSPITVSEAVRSLQVAADLIGAKNK